MNLTISVGDAVRAHNVDNITGPTWDSGDVEPGQYTRVFRFNKAGTFNFVCTPHEGLGMKGTLTVQ